MTTPWADSALSINRNIDTVLRLLRFDKDIVEVAVGALDAAVRDLEQRNLRSSTTPLVNRAQILKNMAHNDSLRPQYEAVFNQCVVLLVSYFGSGLHRLFLASVVTALRSQIELPVRNQELVVSWHGLQRSEGDREAIFADLLVAQKNISFQDMKSIGRAFKELLDVSTDRGLHTDNIILGQAARHAMVHAGAVVDERMIGQLRGVKLRTLKTELRVGQSLRFNPDEVRALADSMRVYVSALCDALDAKFKETNAEPA